MSQSSVQRRGGKHSARALEKAGAALDPDGSMASMVFLWLLPAVAFLLALLRS